MSRRGILLGIGVLFCLVGIWFFRSQRLAPVAPPPPARTAIPRPASLPPLKHRPGITTATPSAPSSPSSTAPSSPSSTAPSSPSSTAPSSPAPGQLKDRRDNPGSDAAGQMAAFQEGIALVDEDIRACLDDWRELVPDLHGSVAVAFQLGAEGLQNVAVTNLAEVPAGPLSCFSSAIWGVDWSGIVENPAEVTWSFEIEPS